MKKFEHSIKNASSLGLLKLSLILCLVSLATPALAAHQESNRLRIQNPELSRSPAHSGASFWKTKTPQTQAKGVFVAVAKPPVKPPAKPLAKPPVAPAKPIAAPPAAPKSPALTGSASPMNVGTILKTFEKPYAGSMQIQLNPIGEAKIMDGKLVFVESFSLDFNPKEGEAVAGYFDPTTNQYKIVIGNKTAVTFKGVGDLAKAQPLVTMDAGNVMVEALIPKPADATVPPANPQSIEDISPSALLVDQKARFFHAHDLLGLAMDTLFMNFPTPVKDTEIVSFEVSPDGSLLLTFGTTINIAPEILSTPEVISFEVTPDGALNLVFASTISFARQVSTVEDTTIASTNDSLGGELILNFGSEVTFVNADSGNTVEDTGPIVSTNDTLDGGELMLNFSTTVGFEKNTDLEPQAPNIQGLGVSGITVTPGGSLGINKEALKDGEIEIVGEATTKNSNIDRVEISLDGGNAWKKADGKESWTFSFTAPKDKKEYKIFVRAINEANLKSGQYSFTLNYDPGAKAEPPSIVEVSVSGDSVNKGSTISLTNEDLEDGKLAITGETIANFSNVERIDVSTNGGTSWSRASGSDSFFYGFTPSSDKATIAVQIRARNEANQTSQVYNFTIRYEKLEEAKPQAPVLEDITFAEHSMTSGDTLEMISDELKGGALRIEGTATTENSSIQQVEVSTDGGSTWNTATGKSDWYYQFTPSSTGTITYRVRVRATNTSRQTSSVFTATLVYENATPPKIVEVEIGTSGAAANGTLEVGSNALENGKLVIKGEAEALTGDITKVEVSTNGGTSYSRASGEDDFEFAFTPATSRTTYNVRVRATDSGNRVSSLYSFTLIYNPAANAEPPEFSDITLLDSSVDAEEEIEVEETAFTGNTMRLAGVAETEGSTITKVEVSLNNGSTYLTVSGTNNWFYNITRPTNETTYQMIVRATNAGGQSTLFRFRLAYKKNAGPPTFGTVTANNKNFVNINDLPFYSTELQSGKIKITGQAISVGSTVRRVTVTVNGDSIPVTGTTNFTAEFTPVFDTSPQPEFTGVSIENLKTANINGRVLMTKTDVQDNRLTVTGKLTLDNAVQELTIEIIAEDAKGQESEPLTSNLVYTVRNTDNIKEIGVTFNGGSSYQKATVTGTNFTYEQAPQDGAEYEIGLRVQLATETDFIEYPDSAWEIDYLNKTWDQKLRDTFTDMMADYITKNSSDFLAFVDDLFASNVDTLNTKSQLEDNLLDRFQCCGTGLQYSIDSVLIASPYTTGTIYFRWQLPGSPAGFISEEWLFKRNEDTNEFMLNKVQTANSFLRFTDKPAFISINSLVSKLFANGLTTATFSGTALDSGGFIVRDGTRLTVSPNLGDVFGTILVNNGSFSFTYTSGTNSGTASIRAESTTNTATSNTRTILLKTVKTITLSSNLATLTADNSSSAVLSGTALDDDGLPVPDGTPITFITTLGSVTPASVTTSGGNFNTTFKSGIIAGNSLTTARGGDQGAQASVTFTLQEDAPPLPPGFFLRDTATAITRQALRHKGREIRQIAPQVNLDSLADDYDTSWMTD